MEGADLQPFHTLNARRDQRLMAAGWTVIRTTWRQMKFRPHELRPVLLKLLAPGSPNGRG